MITGDIQAAFNNVASAAPFVRGGQLRALSTNAPQRLPDYPEVPTMTELGYGHLGRPLWGALLAPAATPKPVLEALNAAVRKSLESDALKEAYGKQLVTATPSGNLDETREWLKGQFAEWRRIIEEVKIEIPE
jgi:tripartite-type tricarboxylate transporter receptor subunit TctC